MSCCNRFNDVAGIEEIQNGLCLAKKGTECIAEILNDIACCRGNLNRNTILINRSCELVEAGMAEICEGLRVIDRCCNRQAVCCIEKGVCALEKGVECVLAGNCKMKNGYVQCGLNQAEKGLEELAAGICAVSNGLCMLG